MFKRYPSIENSYRDKTINYIKEEGHGNKVYVVHEKIDGSNFSFVGDSENISLAKRSSIIKSDENFYNKEIINEKYGRNITALSDFFKGKVLNVFGETFGGVYRHPDVPRVPGVTQVQKRVCYTPNAEFMAFDLYVDGLLQDWDETTKLFDQFEIPHLPELFRGTLDECLNYNIRFNSRIPKLFGLPEVSENLCEGVVIKPVIPSFLYSGSRVILKNKNKRFSERTERKNRVRKVKEYSAPAMSLVQDAVTYVTENRMRAVISKFGEVSQRDSGSLIKNMNLDAIEDFRKDFNEEFMALDKEERRFITKTIGQYSAKILRDNFADIVNGEF